MRVNERMKKLLSIVLTLCMILSYIPAPAYAVGTDCTHHTEHTADCGYVAAVEGVPCTHVHDELCGYAEAVAEVKCACEATDENGALVHTEGCGYVAPVTGADCTHSHDDACGYVASVSGSDCTFHCHICHVQELVDALPGAVTAENAEAVEAQLTAIDNEKASLSDEELVQVDFAKYTVAAEGLGSVYAAVPATDFAVTIADGIENGIVAADVTKAAEGETVTLTVTANEGCVLDALTVTAENATAPTPVEAEGKYTFTMPAGNVTISATFKEVASGIQAGYYLVGTLNGKNKLSVDQDSSDRLLKEDTNVEGQYCLEYTFAAGDKLKIAYFDGQEITKWYKDDDFYPISEAKAGKCILLFRPEGNEIWSSTYFTVTPAYSVTVNTVENGAVTADKAVATADETVTLKVTPAEGYEIDTVSYNDGADHTIAPVEGVYSFTMPAGDVTVTATFKIPVCTCTDKCAEGSVNSGCAVCGAEGADLSACIGTETTASGVDDWCVVDTEAGTVTIDGTLGGKTDATEEDLTALVAALKSYVESGHTTIIVTGSQPAKLLKDGYLIPVVSLAFEQLTYDYQDEKIDSYWGTVDLIYQDVTEIVEYEFYVCDVLKSITLPKVTTVGDRGFWACYYLETLTFGSVVTAINDNSGEVFYDLGYEIDGCNLALNCGQLQAATEYQPNLNTNTWWKDNEWKSITLTHTEGTAATCIAQAVCSVCGDSYGEPTGDHSFDETGKCVCSAQAQTVITVGGETEYYLTLDDAISAVQFCTAEDNARVTLLTPVSSSADIGEGVFTLDLNGQTLTSSDDPDDDFVLRIFGGDVTLQDSAGGGGIVGTNEAENSDAVFVYDGKLTITSGTITGYTRGIKVSGGEVVLAGGIVKEERGSGPAAGIEMNGGSITVSAGSISGNVALQIDDGTVSITGGTITGRKFGICADRSYSGTVTITGGTIVKTGDSGYRGAVTCYGGEILITGGSISGETTDLISDPPNGKITLGLAEDGTGPVFPGGISLYYDEELNAYLDDGVVYWQNNKPIPVKAGQTELPGGDVTVGELNCDHQENTNTERTDNGNGTHSILCGVCGFATETAAHTFDTEGKCVCSAQAAAKIGTTFYATLAQAAEKAAKNDTIVVLTDVTIAEGETLHFPVFVRLDANGNTITCNGDVTIGSEAGILFENELYYYGGDVNGTELCPDREPTYYKAGQGNVINTYDEETDTYIMVMADATLNNESGDGITLPASHLGANLHLEFRGQNTVTAANVGIWVSCAGSVYDLILSGEEGAVLNISAGDATNSSFGIYAETVTITGGTVNIVSGNVPNGATAGISANSVVVEEGATLNMTIGKALSAIGTYGSISGGGTVNGLIAVPADNAFGIAFAASGKTVLTADFTASLEGMLLPFSVPADTSLTVNEGVTLDLSGLTLNDIDFSGEIINHGTILLPEGFVMDNAPEDGTITVGNKSYTWDEENDKWICNNENSHTGGTATCNRGKICDLCGTEYGEKSQTNHDESVMYTETDNGFCPHCGAYQSAVLNGDVYEISNAGQLYWFAAQVNSGKVNIHGKLMNNIVVNENVLNADGSLNGDGSGFRQWTPIGQYISETDNPGFAGTFNGNGKTIRGLYHYGDSAKYAGLFGYSAGTIRDLAIADAYIHTTHSDGRAGSVTGLNEGTVSNCHNSGFVGGNGQIGGIVGRMNAGTIENCSNSGTITGNSYVGGICGYEGGKIQNCSNSGTVNGNLDVGGIAGWNRGAIEKCSNSGTITGNSYVGGVAGLVSGGTINNCYNVGSVEATNECAGGIAGGVQNTSNISNCFSGGPVKVPSSVGGIVGNVLNNSATNVTITNGYYDNHVYSGNDIDTIGPQAKVTRTKVEGKTTEAFSSGEVTWLLNGESAEGVWKQTLNTDAVPGFTGGTVYYGYVDCGSTEAVYTNTIVSTEPVEHDYDNGFCEQVSGQTHYEPATLVTAENCTELGLADSYIGYYAITNAGQLYWIADKVDNDNANFGAAYVVLTDNITVNSGTLTANSADARVWNPIGWYTYRNSDTAVFSGTFDGNGKTVSGLYYNDSAKTSRYIGLVACVAEGGTVKHVTLSNSYISGYRYIGGIAGENYGTITGCVNNAAIGGEGEQGGIVGENYGTVELCGNTGTITNTWCYSGGIVGYSYGIIRNCWNTGSFSGGTSCAGGIVGTQEGRDSLTENCWSKGQVTGMSCGSISGWLNGAATVQNCYSDKDTLVGKRSSNNGDPITTNVQYKSTAAFASGEVAYLLRTLAAAGTNVWGQNLDNGQTVQTVPTFDGADVYCGYASCADTKVKYTNNASVSTTPIAHDWGCTATGAQIVGTCVNGCGTDGGKVTLTLDGTAVYDGTKKTVKAVGSLEGIDTLPGVTYAGDRINVGTFTADLTLEDGTKAQLEVTITAKEITPTVEGVQSTYSYNGEAIKPAVTVKDGETVLREGTNYDVTYGENTNCATGGSVKVTLKGNYEGSAEETFTITAKEITPTVEGVQSTYSYNGEVIKPTVTVKDGEIVLVEGVDYHITYGSNTNVADRGSVKVTLKGNYEGSAEETFAIAPKEVTELTFVGLNEVYAHTGEAIVPTFNVKDGETTLSEGMDYTAAITNNTDVGTATITITLKENYTGTVTKTFEIKPHVHEWNYELSGANTIVAKCSGTIGTCPVKTATIKIAAEDKTYDGNPVTATLTGKIDGVDTPAIRYFKNGAELNESVINAGTYTASIKLGEAEAKVNFTIAKAEIDGSTLINPEFAEGLIYNGTAQALVTKTGSVDGGYIVFSLNPDGEYTAEIPVATEAGKYVVFYRIEGDENHYWEGTSAYNTVTIAKANPEYTIPTGLTATYGDTLAKVELPTGWTWKDAETTSVGNAGTRTFKAIFTPADTGNYNTVETDVTVEVAKADPEYTVPTGLTATYGNTLADVELPAGWTWKDAETTSVGNAGTNTFQAIFTPADTTNYTVVESGVTITVAKATASVETAPAANTLIYTGEAQALVTAGAANNGEMQYSTDNRTWSTTIPTGTNAGDYTVYYKVVGDENHIDTDVQSVVVKIGQLAVAEPTVSGTYTYTGKEQMVTLTGVESYMTVVSGNKAVGAGSYEAVITLDGNHKWADGSDGKVQWSIGKAQAEIAVNTDPITAVYGGTVKLPEATANFGTVTCDTTADKLVNAGTYTVTYTVASTANFDGDSKTVTVTVNPKAITEADVSLNGSLVYTGSELTQAVTVTAGVTYEVTGNKATNVGSYTLTVTASGNYTGSVTKDWSIGKAVATVETAPTAKELTYTGAAQALVTAGTANGGKLVYSLSENGIYAETIPTGTNAGDYMVWYYVQGDDNHADSAKASVKVTIAKAKAEISVNTTPITVTYGEAVMLPTATSSFGTVSRDKTAAELVNAGTYTVTYTVEGTANYEGDTKTLTVIVEKKAVAEPAVTGTYTYTGEEQTAQLTGVESCMTIASGDKATNAGSYEVVITLDGNHKWADGSDGKVQWSIGKAEFGDVYVSQSGMLTYNGTAQTPNVNTDADSVGDQTATFAYRLTENESYGEMPAFTDAGTYTVYYKASAPNHKDATGSFTVTVDKAKAEIAVNTDPITVVYGEAVVLPTATTNFGTVACDKTASDLVNAGTYTVTYSVAGSDNYNGDTKTITVTVNAKVVNQPVIEGIEAVYILSENAITPVPTAVKDGATVIDPSEYTLAYENNTAAGTATVKIVDKDGGNYTVNGSMTFQIVEHEHTWTYTTDSNASKIIATCSNADGHCPNTNGGSVSIQDPDELTYDGSTKDAELVYESWQPEEVTITYNNVDRVNVTGKEIVASIGVVGAGIQSVYTIVAAALPNATLSADSGTYTGQAHTVTVVLDTLVKDTDYTVSIPEDMTNVGTKTITVNGKGNYEGTQNLTYTITKRSDVAAPAPGVGYTIDYAKETITIAEGFEVIDSDGKAVVSGSAADYFGKMLSVRYAETQNTEASAYTSFTLAERPAVPNVTIHNETIKGKADGKITGLDTTMEYSTDGGKHWVSVETTDAGEKNLTVGTTIAVRMKATQTAPCSESKTGTVAAGAAITVTYAENGQAADGMPAQVSDLSYGNKLTKPADPTAKNTDFAFRGWYKDAACTTAWDFAKDTVTEETVTLYAKWEQVYFSVTAEIKDHNNVEYHGEVDVKLMRGDSTIDSVTGTAGSFQFSRHVEGGMYNLVAIYTDSTGEHTKTELITVDHDETFVLKLPAPGVNSHLTVSGNAQTPDVMVGELDAEAESIKQQTGATKVEIEMTVTGKTENQVPATVVNAVEEATDNAAVEYLDITVTKQIDDGAKTEMSETTNLMEIVVPYNTNGKTNLRVFRHHDGQLQEFAQGRDADQTFYYASGYIHIFTKYFSNYMISYEVSHTVTFDANGGTVGTNSLTTQTNGTLSTLPTPTREHYVFKGWYTAKSGGTKVTTDTVFNGDATIYAQWGGYAITVADAKNGTVTVDRSEAPGATEITITVTPKTGYKLSALTVKDAAGKSYVISTDNNGKYYFTMPDADVTVKVTFSKISTSTADTTNPKTGDGFQLVPFSSVAATSLLALAVLMLNKKKLYQK